MTKRLIFLGMMACLWQLSHAQVLEDEDYSREFSWGINKNTNGGLIGGIGFKFSRSIGDDVFRIIGVDLLNVKHPKEQRYFHNSSGTSFIWGKQNFLYSIRGQLGKERLLYKKAPQQGVQISLFYAAGPTLGIVAPYYILSSNGNYEPYDPQVHTSISNVSGSGKLFQGLGESDFVPGVNGKVGISFEFGAFKNNVAGLEVGVASELFPKKIILIPTQENRAWFNSLYFKLYWGTRR